MGLLDIITYYSIPNNEKVKIYKNIYIYIGNDIKIILPNGSYEIKDINNYI